MTIEVYLDPSILSVPNMGQSADEAVRLLKRIEELSVLISMRLPVKIISTYDIYEAVGASYPNVDLIDDFLQMHNIDNYSANDLFRAFTIIFEKIEYAVDDIYGEVLEGTILGGTIDCENISDEVPDSFNRSLLTCSLRRFGGANSFLLMPFVSDLRGQHQIECEINASVKNGNDYSDRLNYECSISIINNISDLEDTEIAVESWRNSETDNDLLCSIWFGARAAMKDRGDKLFEPSFSLGTQFLSSLNANEASGIGRFSQITAKFCFTAVAGYQEQNFGVVRFARPRNRDQAVPLRAQLNTGNPAKRIMAWKLLNSSLEFANVGPKNELAIEIGTENCVSI